MTLLFLLVLLGLVLENNDLLSATVLNYVSLDLSAFDVRSTKGGVLTAGYCEDVLEGYLLAFLNTQLLNEDDITLAYLVLLSAWFKNCKHEKLPLFQYKTRCTQGAFALDPIASGVLLYHSVK